LAITKREDCTNNYGGISELYVFEYEDYARSQIKIVNNFLVTFPFSYIYDLGALQVDFTESATQEDGGVSFDQSGTYKLNKIMSTDNFRLFLNKDWRIIIKDNNGNYRFLGLETGLKIKYTKETGSNLSDFNGFKFSFETKEADSAPFLTDLSNYNIGGTDALQNELQYQF
tara:strand:- start:2128 stop:2640 length:513 start_codon:yes stop_codon:yes gene_type:complete